MIEIKVERVNSVLNLVEEVANLKIENVVFREIPADVAGKMNYLVHNQVALSSEWVITHNFGRTPTVQTFNSAGDKIEADIYNDNLNVTRIIFGRPITGKAVLGG